MVLLAGALFPLEAAAAGAGIVAADLAHPHRLVGRAGHLAGCCRLGAGALAGQLLAQGRHVGLVGGAGVGRAQRGGRLRLGGRRRLGSRGGLGGGLGRGLRLLGGLGLHRAHLDHQQHLDGVLPDGVHHLVEHVKALDAVFHHRVFLAVAAQGDALAQLVHVVDVVHPVAVDAAQQADALQLPHQGRAVAGFLVGKDLHAAVVKGVGHPLGGQAGQLAVGVVEVAVGGQPAVVVAAEGGKVPGGLVLARQEEGAAAVHVVPQHLVDVGADVLAVQHLVALAIDDLALLVHDVVVAQHVFADLEVAALQLFLGALDGGGDHPGLDGGVLVQAHGVHQVLDPLASKQAHQVVLQAEVEAGGAGVALTAGAAPQLVVDAAALVPFGADDEQAAGLPDLLGLLGDLVLILAVQLVEAGPGGQDVGVGGVAVAVGLDQQGFHLLGQGVLGGVGVQQLFAELLFAHLGLGHELGVAAQHDVGAAAGHVGGDGDGALFAGLGHDLGFALVVLGVQDVEVLRPLLQHLGQDLALLHADGAHQHRLALGVALHHLVDDGAVLAGHGGVDHVGVVLADVGLVGGDGDDVQAVDLGELGGLGAGCAGHAGQLFVHAEIVLEGDGGQGLALGGDVDPFLGLDGLVQALVVAAADHQAAGELVHDDDLAVLDHVVDVLFHDAVGLDGLLDVVDQGHVLGGGQVFDLEIVLGLFDAAGGQGGGLVLFVHHVIAVGLVVGLLLAFQLHHHALAQGADELVHLAVQGGRILPAARDDEGGAGLVDEDGVHLVHDGVGVAPLDHVGLVGHHVVPQVIEAELVVGAVGDVGVVGLAAGCAVQPGDDQAHRQPQPAVELAHPLAVALGKVVVDGDHMDPLARQGVEVGGQGGHQGLALAGLHLGDVGPVEGDAAHHLHREVLHPQNAPGGLAAGGKGLGQDVVQGLAFGQAVFQGGGLGLQLAVGHGRISGLQVKDLFGDGIDLLQFAVREGTKDLFYQGHSFTSKSCVYRKTGGKAARCVCFHASFIIHQSGKGCQTFGAVSGKFSVNRKRKAALRTAQGGKKRFYSRPGRSARRSMTVQPVASSRGRVWWPPA